MMAVMQQVLIMLATLAVLIAFHEFGHFWVARRCGVKVLRFSIGFGQRIFTRTDKHGTEFSLSILPLGGYVKMLDEREEEVAEDERHLAFNNKPVAQRIAIVSAGPIANFLLAIVIYWFVFLQGTTALAPVVYHVEADSIADKAGLLEGLEIRFVDGEKTQTAQAVAMQVLNRMGDTGELVLTAALPGSDSVRTYSLQLERWLSDSETDVQPLTSLGLGFYRPDIKAIIAEILPDSAAANAKLSVGDELLSMDGIAIKTWMAWVDYVQAHANIDIELEYLRQGQMLSTRITPLAVESNGKTVGLVGIRVDVPTIPEHLLIAQEYNVLTAWLPALSRTWQTAMFSLSSLKKMIMGDISYKQLSGPISIAKVATRSAHAGLYSYFSLLALLSVSLGVLNLLPIPVLDGGHIFFYLIEWVKGSPVPEKIQLFSFQMGMAVVMSIMVLAVVNDIGRLL